MNQIRQENMEACVICGNHQLPEGQVCCINCIRESMNLTPKSAVDSLVDVEVKEDN